MYQSDSLDVEGEHFVLFTLTFNKFIQIIIDLINIM
jgi:hypothetical protein